jgi:hypothetical protein
MSMPLGNSKEEEKGMKMVGLLAFKNYDSGKADMTNRHLLQKNQAVDANFK